MLKRSGSTKIGNEQELLGALQMDVRLWPMLEMDALNNVQLDVRQQLVSKRITEPLILTKEALKADKEFRFWSKMLDGVDALVYYVEGSGNVTEIRRCWMWVF